MSETKDRITGNLEYIDRRMRERGLDKEFKISHSFRKAEVLPYFYHKKKVCFLDTTAPLFEISS